MPSRKVKVTEDVSLEDNHVGLLLSDSFSLTSYFCTNPWPNADTDFDGGTIANFAQVVDDDISLYTFEDTAFHYLTRYCADANNPLETFDDLQLFNNVQELDPVSGPEDDVLGKYVLFSDDTSDVIGLQIFSNPPNANNKHRLNQRMVYRQI